MDKLLGLLGLCLRAGMLVCGDDAVADTVSAGEGKLILLAQDAGASIQKRTARYTIPVIQMGCGTEQLGGALGRRPTAVCCITDIGFAAAAAQKAAETNEQYYALAQQLGEKKKRVESRRGSRKPRKKSSKRNQSIDTTRGGERA